MNVQLMTDEEVRVVLAFFDLERILKREVSEKLEDLVYDFGRLDKDKREGLFERAYDDIGRGKYKLALIDEDGRDLFYHGADLFKGKNVGEGEVHEDN